MTVAYVGFSFFVYQNRPIYAKSVHPEIGKFFLKKTQSCPSSYFLVFALHPHNSFWFALHPHNSFKCRRNVAKVLFFLKFFNYLLGSSTLNYQSSDIYSSEIFQEHFLALFQAIGSNFYLVAEKQSNFANTG